MKRILTIKVFDDDKEIDSFEFPFDDISKPIALPNDDFYRGLSFHMSVDGHGGFQFSPDGYEMWIRFGDERTGQLIEYLGGKSHKLLFRTKVVE